MARLLTTTVRRPSRPRSSTNPTPAGSSGRASPNGPGATGASAGAAPRLGHGRTAVGPRSLMLELRGACHAPAPRGRASPAGLRASASSTSSRAETSPRRTRPACAATPPNARSCWSTPQRSLSRSARRSQRGTHPAACGATRAAGSRGAWMSTAARNMVASVMPRPGKPARAIARPPAAAPSR